MQDGNTVESEFEESLALGKHNEKVIAHEFGYQGVPLAATQGKHDFDFYLPDGRSLEVKIDLRSQATGCGAIEWPTLQRNAEIYVYTFTYARVFTHAELKALYLSGKVPHKGFGSVGYTGRYVKGMGKQGIPLWQFIDSLKTKH
jgi:hypothetical protein